MIEKKNNSKAAEVILKRQVDSYSNHRLNKKYNSLLSLLHIGRVNSKQLSALIAETGYTKFEGLFADEE